MIFGPGTIICWPQRQITKSSVSFRRKGFQYPPSLPIPVLVPGHALTPPSCQLASEAPPHPAIYKSLQGSFQSQRFHHESHTILLSAPTYEWLSDLFRLVFTSLSPEFQALQEGPCPVCLANQMPRNATGPCCNCVDTRLG